MFIILIIIYFIENPKLDQFNIVNKNLKYIAKVKIKIKIKILLNT